MSNNRNTRTLEIDVSDAPMLMRAMAVGAATALMCGHRDAQARFERYKDMLQAFVPAEANFFDEEAWGEIGMALAKAQAFRVFIDMDPFSKRRQAKGEYVGRYNARLELWVAIETGGETETFCAKYGVNCEPKGDPRVKAVFDVLTDLAPINCQGAYHDQFEFA